MMQQEFEERVGFNVSSQVYHDVIEPMYTDSRMLNKDIFCKMFNKSFLKRVAGVGLTKGCIVSVFNGRADGSHAIVKKDAVDFGRQFPQILPMYALDLGINNKVRWIAGGKEYD